MHIKLLAAIIGIFCLSAFSAKAQVEVDAWSRLNENENQEVLLEFNIKEGWHIFAPYEQEFGSPLQINWQLSDDETIAEQSFSKPKVFDDNGFIYDGYENKFFYKTTIKTNNPNRITKVVIDWQACAGDECLPQRKELIVQAADSAMFNQKINEAETSFAGGDIEEVNWLKIAGLAFIAGLLLNLMPCVLPVLGLKIMACLKATAANRLREAFFYTCGIVISMLILAGLLLLLRQTNPHLGWGFQMQSPWFVGIMLIIFILLTLMAFDLITLHGGWLSKLTNLHFQNCQVDALISGILAVLIASPCTAPFMGAVIGYAIVAPAHIYFPMFLSLGLGYALPFALLTVYPKAMQKIMPHPGKWMKTVKIILGIPLLLTCLWLGWLLCTQLGTKLNLRHSEWQEYSNAKVEQALQNNRPVFIDFTADWCITCLVNKKTSLYSDTMIDLVKANNILLLKADITKFNPEAAEGMKKYHRAAVPLYIYYDGKSDDYLTLPPILTPQILQEYLR